MGDVVQTEETEAFARLVLCAFPRSGSCRPAWHPFDDSFCLSQPLSVCSPVVPGLHEGWTVVVPRP